MTRMKAILVLVAALAFAAASYAARNFRGYDAQAFPVPVIDPPLQPVGWAFSIWGLIYLGLIAQAGYGLLRRAEAPGWDAGRWPLFLSMALGASWLEVAMRAPVLATVQIWVMAATALWAMARTPVAAVGRWAAAAPALYAGWLTAATAVATGTVLIGYGLLAPMTSSYLLLSLAALVALALIWRLGPSPAYAAGVIWALFGVAVANWGAPGGLAALSIAFALALAALTLWRAGRG